MLANKDPKLLEKLINLELTEIKDYFDSNGLSINTKKTTFLHFCPKQTKKPTLTVKLGETQLIESSHTTFLGIILDNKLDFKYQYEKIYEKAKLGLNGLILTKNQLNQRAKTMIYNSLIHSHFMYGSLIWLNYLTNKQINSLKTIQKKALRIIHNKPYNSHTSKLFHTSKITKIEHLHEKESLILMFKYMNNKLPQDTQKLISTNIQTPNIETRSMTANQLKPKRRITKGVHDIIDAWNTNNTQHRCHHPHHPKHYQHW